MNVFDFLFCSRLLIVPFVLAFAHLAIPLLLASMRVGVVALLPSRSDPRPPFITDCPSAQIYNRTSMQHSTLITNGHTRPVERLRYMDRYMASGGRDSVVKIWAL